MHILLLDNYDSFTYNLLNLLRRFRKHRLEVLQPHQIVMDELAAFDRIFFSPGPDIPQHGDMMWQILECYHKEKGIFGICLGFHAIAMYFGARLINLNEVAHGRSRPMTVTDPDERMFRGIPSPFIAGLYHSWTPDRETFPDELRITARSEEGLIMAHAHRKYNLRGVQFHPESIMTPMGSRMIANWLDPGEN